MSSVVSVSGGSVSSVSASVGSTDSSVIFWSDPYDTYDVRSSSSCHCCNNPLDKNRFRLPSERPYGQGQCVSYAYYFCTDDCRHKFYETALNLTNKKLDDVLEIDGQSGLWSIQSKYPAMSVDGVGLYLYRIKNNTLYPKIYTLISISKINEAKVVRKVGNIDIDEYCRYIDDESEEVQSGEIQTDSVTHSSDNLTSC
jgi:hypothetical protein